jgi:sulfate adenylyltransferase subunit 1
MPSLDRESLDHVRNTSGDRPAFSQFLEQNLNTELLRFTTAGSVDDGKSTLIGRLLHDSKSVYEDQLASVKNSRVNRSSGPIDFSLLTDGLRAEREQGITIDVAYRYFATSRRKFIIADTPGHEQYTRNMATGASTADLAVILIDATKGILPQTRRHAFIASLLGIRNVLAAVNKMDLAAYSDEIFSAVGRDFLRLAAQLGFAGVQCVPISALEGDNVVDRSLRTPWYSGPTMLEHLETVPLRVDEEAASLRFPVQTVIRPDATFRGFAGRIASGLLRPGDPVLALPSGQRTRIKEIVTFAGNLPEAFAPMSVTLQLRDEIDLSRGDMLVSPENPPRVVRNFDAMVVWLHAQPLEPGCAYFVKHTSRQTKIRATRIHHRVNVNTLEHEPTSQLQMNEIASVAFESHIPLFLDPYSGNRTTGSFILIDPATNATVGAGMVRDEASSNSATDSRDPVVTYDSGVPPRERFERNGHSPGVLLLENRPDIAARLERSLFDRGFQVLHVGAGELAAQSFGDVSRIVWGAGVVLIYSGNTLPGDMKRRLSSELDARFFDAAPNLSDDDAGDQALAFALSLLLNSRRTNHGKVN